MIGFNCSIIYLFNNQADQLVITQILIRWVELNEEEQVLRYIAKEVVHLSKSSRHQFDKKSHDETLPNTICTDQDINDPSYQTMPRYFHQRYRSECINLADICSTAKANFNAGMFSCYKALS